MRKKLLILGSAAILLALAGCEKNPSGGDGSFTVSLEDSPADVVWADGETVGVFGSDRQLCQFTVSEADGSSAKISGSVSSSDTYYAFYPYSASPSWNGSTYTVSIPSTQTAVAGGVAQGSSYYVASGTNSSKHFDFVNIFGYLSFIGDFGGHKITSVTVTSNNNLTGTARVTYSGSGEPSSSISLSPGKTITLTSASVMEGGYTYLITLLPGSYSNLTLTFTSSTGESQSVEMGTVTVTRNEITELTAVSLPEESWTTDPSSGPFTYAQGTVTWSDGTPASGIVVSDGFNCVQTDSNGKFTVSTSSDTWYIYISLPSDAVISKNDVGIPDFYLSYDNMQLDYNFTLTKQAVESEFALVAMADPQAHYAKRGSLKAADTDRFRDESVPTINSHISGLTIPVYGVTLGDIVYSAGSRNSVPGMSTMRSYCSNLNMPVFQVMGNHDYTYFYGESNPLTTDETSSTLNLKAQRSFESVFGPINYSFNRGNTHVVCMKDIDFKSTTDAGSDGYDCGFTNEQLSWLRQDLAYVSTDMQLLLCVHIPLSTRTSDTNVTNVLNTISPYKNVTIFSGHTHYQRGYSNAGGTTAFEKIHAAVCGSWWNAKLEGDGCPLGFTVYTFKDGEITDEYFSGCNDGMNTRDYQMRLYRGNLLTGGAYAYFQWPHSSSTLLINVFNGDSRWKVEVFENGVSKGYASQISASRSYWSSVTAGSTYAVSSSSSQDWYSIGLLIGVLGCGTSSTSYYTANYHMWKYTISDTSATIKVVATDPHGTQYTCEEIVEDGTTYPTMYRY